MDHYVPTFEEMEAHEKLTSNQIYYIDNSKSKQVEFTGLQNKKERNFYVVTENFHIIYDDQIYYYCHKIKRNSDKVSTIDKLLDIIEQVYHYDLYGTYENFAKSYFYPKDYKLHATEEWVKHWQISDIVTIKSVKGKYNYICTNSKLKMSYSLETDKELLDILELWAYYELYGKYGEFEEGYNVFDCSNKHINNESLIKKKH